MRLRVIAGTHSGRVFSAPKGFATHPMSERVRGSLFNILGDIAGYEVLDPFGGSGALSFEAVSRGAKHATVIEKDRPAQKIISENITTLGMDEKITLIKAGAASWSSTKEQKIFDLILCDPPYNNLQLSTIGRLVMHLKPNGLMVLSHPGRESAPTVNGVVVVDKRSYGDAALAIYQLAV
jgi:16S rRNA (guanine966-N2)-methyltransferase